MWPCVLVVVPSWMGRGGGGQCQWRIKRRYYTLVMTFLFFVMGGIFYAFIHQQRLLMKGVATWMEEAATASSSTTTTTTTSDPTTAISSTPRTTNQQQEHLPNTNNYNVNSINQHEEISSSTTTTIDSQKQPPIPQQIWLASMIRNTNDISPKMFQQMMILNCDYSINLHLLVGSQTSAKLFYLKRKNYIRTRFNTTTKETTNQSMSNNKTSTELLQDAFASCGKLIIDVEPTKETILCQYLNQQRRRNNETTSNNIHHQEDPFPFLINSSPKRKPPSPVTPPKKKSQQQTTPVNKKNNDHRQLNLFLQRRMKRTNDGTRNKYKTKQQSTTTTNQNKNVEPTGISQEHRMLRSKTKEHTSTTATNNNKKKQPPLVNATYENMKTKQDLYRQYLEKVKERKQQQQQQMIMSTTSSEITNTANNNNDNTTTTTTTTISTSSTNMDINSIFQKKKHKKKTFASNRIERIQRIAFWRHYQRSSLERIIYPSSLSSSSSEASSSSSYSHYGTINYANCTLQAGTTPTPKRQIMRRSLQSEIDSNFDKNKNVVDYDERRKQDVVILLDPDIESLGPSSQTDEDILSLLMKEIYRVQGYYSTKNNDVDDDFSVENKEDEWHIICALGVECTNRYYDTFASVMWRDTWIFPRIGRWIDTLKNKTRKEKLEFETNVLFPYQNTSLVLAGQYFQVPNAKNKGQMNMLYLRSYLMDLQKEQQQQQLKHDEQMVNATTRKMASQSSTMVHSDSNDNDDLQRLPPPPPVRMRSCFGGVAIYRADVFFCPSCDYTYLRSAEKEDNHKEGDEVHDTLHDVTQEAKMMVPFHHEKSSSSLSLHNGLLSMNATHLRLKYGNKFGQICEHVLFHECLHQHYYNNNKTFLASSTTSNNKYYEFDNYNHIRIGIQPLLQPQYHGNGGDVPCSTKSNTKPSSLLDQLKQRKQQASKI